MITLGPELYDRLAAQAKLHGILVTELVRARVIPEWASEHRAEIHEAEVAEEIRRNKEPEKLKELDL